jgi:L-fuculose-phosphate aldolase
MTGEVYTGTKFRTIFADSHPPQNSRLNELVEWSHRLADWGLVATAMGNISFRTASGFIISPTGTDPRTITATQFVEVLEVDMAARTLRVHGASEPSSESMLHDAIYRARPEIQAVFHGHDARVLARAEQLFLPVTAKEQPYGTPALVNEVLAILPGADLFVMRNHGFVALGLTMADAGRRVEELLWKL